jgi:hypothetical protein
MISSNGHHSTSAARHFHKRGKHNLFREILSFMKYEDD